MKINAKTERQIIGLEVTHQGERRRIIAYVREQNKYLLSGLGEPVVRGDFTIYRESNDNQVKNC